MLRKSFGGIVWLLLSVLLPSLVGCDAISVDAPPNQIASIKAHRHSVNPLITPDSSASLGDNINGPSVIRVPSWIDHPLGDYYMYFAHHTGKYIRLAYADSPTGPWTVYEPGTLTLAQASRFRGHIASPDVHVDHERQQIRMYFHGSVADRKGQWTGVAVSPDGLQFEASDKLLGKFYFRVWKWQGAWYALAKDWDSGWGELYRSQTGLDGFERRGRFLRRVRHSAVLVKGHQLIIFYSRKGDAPERILATTVDMRPDWRQWQASEPLDVLKPEADYEGAAYPVIPSRYGGATEVHQVRDPYVYEHDGRILLYYSIAGETGIAVAELDIELKSIPNDPIN